MTGHDTAAASLKPTAPRLRARQVHAYMSLTKKGDGQVPIDKGLLRWISPSTPQAFLGGGNKS